MGTPFCLSSERGRCKPMEIGALSDTVHSGCPFFLIRVRRPGLGGLWLLRRAHLIFSRGPDERHHQAQHPRPRRPGRRRSARSVRTREAEAHTDRDDHRATGLGRPRRSGRRHARATGRPHLRHGETHRESALGCRTAARRAQCEERGGCRRRRRIRAQVLRAARAPFRRPQLPGLLGRWRGRNRRQALPRGRHAWHGCRHGRRRRHRNDRGGRVARPGLRRRRLGGQGHSGPAPAPRSASPGSASAAASECWCGHTV